jgi:endonuclease YncB( thermonuclease family)
MIIEKFVSAYSPNKLVLHIKDYGKNIPVKVKGISAPQIDGKCKKERLIAMEANHLVKSFFLRAKSMELKNVKKGKFLEADVYVNGKSLATYLIEFQYAVPTDEATEYDWC